MIIFLVTKKQPNLITNSRVFGVVKCNIIRLDIYKNVCIKRLELQIESLVSQVDKSVNFEFGSSLLENRHSIWVWRTSVVGHGFVVSKRS